MEATRRSGQRVNCTGAPQTGDYGTAHHFPHGDEEARLYLNIQLGQINLGSHWTATSSKLSLYTLQVSFGSE